MADEASKIPSPFDVRTIKYLVGLMSRHDLSEIDLREGDLRIRLRRGRREIPLTPLAAPASAAAAPPSAAAAPVSNPPPADKNAKPAHFITSPTPGTFYSTPDPKAEPFVRVGSRVEPSTVVCLIEAMKVFNDITADCTGIISEILVENQQPVEFGQPLFKVELTG